MNLLLYKWRTGAVSDEQVIGSLRQEHFQSKAKGRGLLALLLLAMGDKTRGTQSLQSFAKKDSQKGLEFQNLKL